MSNTYRAKWCDFGFAIFEHQDRRSCSPVGTINWRAPELYDSEHSSTKASDVWALGMVFFELASRQVPFHDAQTPEQIEDWIKAGTGENVPIECERDQPGFANLMKDCWKERTARPTVEQLMTRIAALN